MSRIAVIGSCITRDLWPILGDDPSNLLYISRTSLASLFSNPVASLNLDDNPPPPLKRHQHNSVVADLSKTALRDLIKHEPSHIILDFIDERFDLLSADGAIVSHSWELEVSGYRRQPGLCQARSVPRLSTASDMFWLRGLAELAMLIEQTPLRNSKIILHAAQWAGDYLDEDGARQSFPDELELMAGLQTSCRDHNRLLDRYQASFTRQFRDASIVAAPEFRLADAAHRWGLSPFHYVDEYYRTIWQQLNALGV